MILPGYENFPSIRKTIQVATHKAFLQTCCFCILLIVAVSLSGEYIHYRSRVRLVADSLQKNLAHLLGVGDYFQIKRQIASIVDGGHFAGVWVYESVRKQLISHSSVLADSVPQYDERPGNSLFLVERRLFLSTNFPIYGPSGQILGSFKIAAAIPMASILLWTLGLITLFLFLAWFAFYQFNRLAGRITTPMLTFSSHIKKVSPEAIRPSIEVGDLKFKEIVESYTVFADLMDRLEKAREKERESEKTQTMAEIAQQVSHDIRSPLMALVFLSEAMQELPEQKRTLIKGAINRIIDISNNLNFRSKLPASVSKLSGPPSEESREPFLLWPALEPLVSEKRVVLSHESQISIELIGDDRCYGTFVQLDMRQFKAAISNILNNAIEAMENRSGKVTVAMKSHSKGCDVCITDTGKGIPKEMMDRLGERGFTHGKKLGSGLGVYQARQAIMQGGGRISFRSEENSGTTVTISLPRCEPPNWYVEELRLDPATEVVVLDDDVSIHNIWKERLPKQVPSRYFTSAEEFSQWFLAGGKSSPHLYLFDYELGTKESGMEMVRRFHLESSAVLITSHFEEHRVYSECQKYGIGLIPKSLIGHVPMRISS